jgi:hypothetical protein
VKRKVDQYVKVPLWWAEQAAAATGTQKAFVWVWLLYLAWKASSNTVTVPNGKLEAYGVSRKVKYKVLRELEAAGLIKVERQVRKSPVVTLLLYV